MISKQHCEALTDLAALFAALFPVHSSPSEIKYAYAMSNPEDVKTHFRIA